MNFKLNDMDREKMPGTNRRGKRTIAKEKLYKNILKNIRTIYPNFNIFSIYFVTTRFTKSGTGQYFWRVY